MTYFLRFNTFLLCCVNFKIFLLPIWVLLFDMTVAILVFYFRKVPIIGKHTKKITCGAWSAEGLLALGSEDKSITVSNSEGDTLRHTSLRAEPSSIQFSEMKGDERSTFGENTVYCYISIYALFYIAVLYKAFV